MKRGRFNQDDAQGEVKPSRSAKKRDALALQKLGEKLIHLSAAARKQIDLPEEIIQALELLDKITDHEGRRRQKQYIGRLMRDVDSEPIQREIDKIRHIHSKEINAFQEAEEWRRKFLESEENEFEHILEEFYSAQSNDLSANPSMEELRETAIRARKQMRGSGNKTGSINYPRKLFRMISQIMNNQG